MSHPNPFAQQRPFQQWGADAALRTEPDGENPLRNISVLRENLPAAPESLGPESARPGVLRHPDKAAG
jgi:hypothetical protein